MDQNITYLVLFACLLYLKLVDKNKDTIKIIVSVGISYLVYKLFQGDKTEGFEFPSSPCVASIGFMYNPSPVGPGTNLDGRCECQYSSPAASATGGCAVTPGLVGGTCEDWLFSDGTRASPARCEQGFSIDHRTYTSSMTAIPTTQCCKKDPPNPACAGSPCGANGTCWSGCSGGEEVCTHTTGYACVCRGGWSGTNCLTSPKPASHPAVIPPLPHHPSHSPSAPPSASPCGMFEVQDCEGYTGYVSSAVTVLFIIVVVTLAASRAKKWHTSRQPAAGGGLAALIP